MANTMRWRYGDTNPVLLPVESTSEIEIGDLVFLDTGFAKPATGLVDQGSTLLNQTGFQDAFVGVAMQASPLGEANSVRIATTGVFEFDCDSATWELGSLAAVATDASGNSLYDQKVVEGSTESASLGRCVKQAVSATTRVLIDVVGTVTRGGVQSQE